MILLLGQYFFILFSKNIKSQLKLKDQNKLAQPPLYAYYTKFFLFLKVTQTYSCFMNILHLNLIFNNIFHGIVYWSLIIFLEQMKN